MSETKLLQCPFCGGEAEFVRDTERKDIFGSSDYVYVRCKKCHAQTTKIYYSAEFHKLDEEYALAEKAWNTRKPMVDIVQSLEEAMERQWGYYNKAKATGNIRQMDYSDGCAEGLTTSIEIVKEEGGFCD